MKRRSFYSAILFMIFTIALAWSSNEKVMAACQHKAAANYTVTKEATCGASGTKVRKCTKCGYVLETQTIPALGHKWDSGAVTKAATCTAKGVKTYRCTRGNCHGEKKSDISPLGHSPASSYTTTKAATCTSTGTQVRKCTRCSANVETKTIAALGHNWDGGSVTKKATCTAKGTKTYKCKRSGCSSTKTETIQPTGHKASGSYTTITKATCTADGSEGRKCSNCGSYVEKRTIKKLGHDMDAGTVTKQPTCTAKGVKTYKCKRSGCTHTTTSELQPLGHNASGSYTTTKAATCTTTGTQVRKCTRCNANLETKTIAPLGHDYSKATCQKLATCKRCGKTTGELAEHDYSVLDEEMSNEYGGHAPTATLSGNAVYKCKWCESRITKYEPRVHDNSNIVSKKVDIAIDELLTHYKAKLNAVSSANIKFDGYNETQYKQFLNDVIKALNNDKQGVKKDNCFVQVDEAAVYFDSNPGDYIKDMGWDEEMEKLQKKVNIAMDFVGFVPYVGDALAVGQTVYDIVTFNESELRKPEGVYLQYYNANSWSEYWNTKKEYKPFTESGYTNITDLVSDTLKQNYSYKGQADNGYDAYKAQRGDLYIKMTIITNTESYYCSWNPNGSYWDPYVQVEMIIKPDGSMKYISTFETIFTEYCVK
ncbi:MAG: hypothetical protein IKN54_09785 [Lachnospiraceae bacterium]|nr:hypothetical protein [Lachnospiraceae bacterium]